MIHAFLLITFGFSATSERTVYILCKHTMICVSHCWLLFSLQQAPATLTTLLNVSTATPCDHSDFLFLFQVLSQVACFFLFALILLDCVIPYYLSLLVTQISVSRWTVLVWPIFSFSGNNYQLSIYGNKNLFYTRLFLFCCFHLMCVCEGQRDSWHFQGQDASGDERKSELCKRLKIILQKETPINFFAIRHGLFFLLKSFSFFFKP